MARSYLPIPERWHRITLVPDRKAGFIEAVESGGTPKTTEEEFWDGDVPWLTPKEITADNTPLYVSHTERTITSAGLSSSAAKIMPAGTVLLTKRAPVGTVAIAAVPITTNQGFLNFVCGEKLRPLYLAFWFKSNKPYLDAVANGSTYPELYKSDLFEFELGIPPVDEQDRIVDIFLAIQKLIFACSMAEQSSRTPASVREIQARIRHILSLREKIAPFLLTGHLSPTNVDLPTHIEAA
ncbi:Type I restriction-modification system specificity subunit [Roseomonas mucosa]|uniref:restriction endonuclease subunit S n=1 Tax=Roseomonas mucosa TaxID=207340 RepID=UPI00220C71CA|nr:restriction endonuclease subunit S [Roseomonas mucosa]QDJ10331.1 Type I restriction-modification system specificity subunit [Roseomonas mucosa]